MSTTLLRTVALLAATFIAACAGEATPPSYTLGTRDTSIGTVLVDARGMTLYTYTDDEPGVSNCGMICREYWPPALAPADAQPSGDITLVTLDDGTKQWAYNDRPLYTYVEDKAPGDVTGEGVEGEWYVVKR
jgi:predicted lipoprotein with Yx(FWY)xxD motif